MDEHTADCVAQYPGSPPPSDLPTAAQRQALKGCDAESLYYGIGQPADPVRARLCAFTEPDSFAQKGPFTGNTLLMTIYANGVGAGRNLTYAEQLACRLRETEKLVELTSLGKRRDYSWCDQQLDNISGRYCGWHSQRIAVWKRQQQLNAFALTLPPHVRASFAALRVAQSAWAQARSWNEEDQTGSDRWEVVMVEKQLQDDDFLQMLRRLQTGRPPRLDIAQLTAANARMHHSLQALPPLLQHPPAEWLGPAIRPEGILAAQQAWLRYREAWASFAAIAYPKWGRGGAEAWVTMKRADMLEHLLAEQQPRQHPAPDLSVLP